jgi:hypothetical protein
MGSLFQESTTFNRYIKMNFEGVNLTSDAGIVSFKEFDEKIWIS